ncbi:MAG: glycosyltransferase family 2 protein [Alistipes sp.]|nr:glycosyltransferase family 2 protein [Alistipes sp.]MBR0338753.1 glycosyltransferase family 2 protein [Alistipes sp.]
MESRYKISLIVPIYGVEQYICQCAESVLGQTFDDIQFIFVNDGTKDRSMELLEALIEERFSHLKERIVIINKENGGLPSARKAGLERAEGEYILFADSDDWLELNAVERVMAEAERTDADLIYFHLVKEYGGGKQSVKHERTYTAETKRLWVRNILNYNSYGYTVTKCFRRRLYTDNFVSFPKLGMHEDIYLMSQIIFYAESIAHLPETLYHYRKTNSASMCAQKRSVRHMASSRNLLGLYVDYKDRLEGSPVEGVVDGIVLRAGWHSIIHKGNLFEEFPWLSEAISKAKLSTHYRTPLLFQIFVKIYNRCRM